MYNFMNILHYYSFFDDNPHRRIDICSHIHSLFLFKLTSFNRLRFNRFVLIDAAKLIKKFFRVIILSVAFGYGFSDAEFQTRNFKRPTQTKTQGAKNDRNYKR